MDVKAGSWSLSAKDLMLSNFGAGEDSWESFGLQRDQTSQSERKSTLNIQCKDWCWSWNSSTLATWCKELIHWKRLWFWERLRAGWEAGDRGWDSWMASWTQWTWVWATTGESEGQESLACCSPWTRKESLSDWNDAEYVMWNARLNDSSWNQNFWEKYQQSQIWRWYHSNSRKQSGTKDSLDES